MKFDLNEYLPLSGYNKGYDFFDTLKPLGEKAELIIPASVGYEWLKGFYSALYDNGFDDTMINVVSEDESLIEDINGIINSLTIRKRYTQKDLCSFLIKRLEVLSSESDNEIQTVHFCSMLIGALTLADEMKSLENDKIDSIMNMIVEYEQSGSLHRPNKLQVLIDYITILGEKE
jgi:hypothetical protein